MRRTIEKLIQERREKEDLFLKKLEDLKHYGQSLERLEDQTKSKTFFSLSKKSLQKILAETLNATKNLTAVAADLLEIQPALMDAKDKEWDALGNNHVGLIFKSMEWRVDKLAAEYEDAHILMKKFLLLKEQLGRLQAALEKQKLPSAGQVREILEPLEEWRYMSFENRFRGHEEEVKKQQERYIAYFRPGGKILDLGCGRGEFLELLQETGFQGFGIDGNSQMIDSCLDKGLHAQKGDILEKLADWPDASLDGIFSSQVIEHLPPACLKRMVELSHAKLAPAGALVLETVNPTSVFALVRIYFLDLSHRLPVHPQALKFLLESSGFDGVEIVYSGELADDRLEILPGADELRSLLNRNIDRLNDLLYAAPNYAAIGRKK
jgi:O-antigen chain-terminating methyltransferase